MLSNLLLIEKRERAKKKKASDASEGENEDFSEKNTLTWIFQKRKGVF